MPTRDPADEEDQDRCTRVHAVDVDVTPLCGGAVFALAVRAVGVVIVLVVAAAYLLAI